VSDAIILTEGLRKEFGASVAVADLSLRVNPGEVFGFLGPNGAGKTTSIKMLLGLVTPNGGRGQMLGAPLGDRQARGSVGFLPEHFRFHDCLTARELLRFHGRLFGLRGAMLEARIQHLLARVDMLDAADRPLRGYSKGMLQRAGLAQALVNDPQLVFLDEPTSGLDPLGRLLVRDIIAELRSKSVTVFLNSHLLGEVEATCDRVAFVRQGRLVHEMPLGNAATQLEVELRIGTVTEDLTEGLASFGTCIDQQPNGLLSMHIDRDDVLPEMAAGLVGRGARLYERRSRLKSLEEWFVEVMGDERPG
jgi:ABC-2 type transport system ATP-binding protein